MNREQILGILYDLSLTIGGELDLDSLLTRTLQRLLFHTSFPAAVILADRHDSEFGISASLEKALGDYQLIELCGSRLNLSAGLLGAKVELLDDPALLSAFVCCCSNYWTEVRLCWPAWRQSLLCVKIAHNHCIMASAVSEVILSPVSWG